MEPAKKSRTKKKMVDETSIISTYMNQVLTQNEVPKNVFVFCKANEIDEADFYTFFNSINSLKQEIWVKFFENVQVTIQSDASYETYTDKNKLLTLYFSLFELLTLNRSYILFSLKDNKEGLKNLKTLKLFRTHFKSFIAVIIESSDTGSDKLKRVSKPIFQEGAWVQFLFLLKFWMDDTSKGFEKTDILIEKSVNTVVDLFDTKPLESLFDLGKFLWKEKMS